MGLIRLIILVLVVWMLLRLFRKFKASQTVKNGKKQPLEHKNMVLCQYCSVHVPENKAVQHEQNWFCSDKHRDKYLSRKD